MFQRYTKYQLIVVMSCLVWFFAGYLVNSSPWLSTLLAAFNTLIDVCIQVCSVRYKLRLAEHMSNQRQRSLWPDEIKRFFAIAFCNTTQCCLLFVTFCGTFLKKSSFRGSEFSCQWSKKVQDTRNICRIPVYKRFCSFQITLVKYIN